MLYTWNTIYTIMFVVFSYSKKAYDCMYLTEESARDGSDDSDDQGRRNVSDRQTPAPFTSLSRPASVAVISSNLSVNINIT